MSNNREIFLNHLGLPSKNPLAIEIESANGIYMYDTKGKEYIDMVSGVSVSNVGHRHPKIVQAIKAQLDKYMHLMVYGEIIQTPQVQLAKKLSDNLPASLDSVYFVNSGSEAIEGSIKLAKRFTTRTEIIAFKNAYHGGTHGALSILGSESLKNAYRPLLPDIKHLNFNSFEDLHKISKNTACVIVEAVQAEAGIIIPEQHFLSALKERCIQTGTLLILDDIQMGFGRTGKLFSFENFNFTPDILCVAKGMGGGMPIGAFISSKEIMDTLTFNPELGHITTFGGHPVCCAASLANLQLILDEKLADQANLKGSHFKEALTDIEHIKEIRQIGLMLGIELENNTITDRLMNILIEQGLISDRFLFKPNAFRIAPPLNISQAEIEKTIILIKMCFDKL